MAEFLSSLKNPLGHPVECRAQHPNLIFGGHTDSCRIIFACDAFQADFKGLQRPRYSLGNTEPEKRGKKYHHDSREDDPIQVTTDRGEEFFPNRGVLENDGTWGPFAPPRFFVSKRNHYLTRPIRV